MKVVFTGSHKIGKTTLIHIIQKEFSGQLTAVPDALDVLKEGGFPEPFSEQSFRSQQRAVYYLQRELETIISEEAKGRLILCDHGSLDALALWPGKVEDFFDDIRSDLKTELERYDWILLFEGTLQSQQEKEDVFFSIRQSDPFQDKHKYKFNDPAQYWSQHSQVLRISADSTFSEICLKANEVIRGILSGESLQELRRYEGHPPKHLEDSERTLEL